MTEACLMLQIADVRVSFAVGPVHIVESCLGYSGKPLIGWATAPNCLAHQLRKVLWSVLDSCRIFADL
jgi:hypothetical protein